VCGGSRLNIAGKFTFLVFSLFLATILFCDKKNNYTPEQVIENVKSAYYKKDAKELITYLSQEKIKQLEEFLEIMRSAFSKLPESAQENLAQIMGVKSKPLPEISLAEYLQYSMNHEGTGMDADNVIFPIHILNEYQIVSRDFTENEGSLTLADTSIINFVKQEGQWKISHVKWVPQVLNSDDETDSQE